MSEKITVIYRLLLIIEPSWINGDMYNWGVIKLRRMRWGWRIGWISKVRDIALDGILEFISIIWDRSKEGVQIVWAKHCEWFDAPEVRVC